jgi:hypothetical protein
MRYVSFSSQEHQAPISTAASSIPHYKNVMMTSTKITLHFRMHGEMRVRRVSYSSISDLPKSQSTSLQHWTISGISTPSSAFGPMPYASINQIFQSVITKSD